MNQAENKSNNYLFLGKLKVVQGQIYGQTSAMKPSSIRGTMAVLQAVVWCRELGRPKTLKIMAPPLRPK